MNLSRTQLIVCLLAIIGIGFALLWFADPIDLDIISLELKYMWLAIGIGYLIASLPIWDPIQADELGVRLVLGVATENLEAGVPFAPPGIVEIERAPKSVAQKEFPAEPENIFRNKEGESENAPPGKQPPLRVTFAEKPLSETEAQALFGELYAIWPPEVADLTEKNLIRFDHTEGEDGLGSTRITAEVPHVARIRVENLRKLIQNIPPHPVTGTRIDEVFRQIEDEQIVVLNTILTKMTVAQALRNILWINAVMFLKVSRRIQAAVTSETITISGHDRTIPFSEGRSDEWGINLEGSFLKGINLNHGLNSAISSVAEKTFAAAAAVREAEGQKQAEILKGQAAAQAASDLVRMTLEGRATGLAAIGKVANTQGGRMAIASEGARAVADGGNAVITGPDGIGQLIGLVAGAAKAVDKAKEKDE